MALNLRWASANRQICVLEEESTRVTLSSHLWEHCTEDYK